MRHERIPTFHAAGRSSSGSTTRGVASAINVCGYRIKPQENGAQTERNLGMCAILFFRKQKQKRSSQSREDLFCLVFSLSENSRIRCKEGRYPRPSSPATRALRAELRLFACHHTRSFQRGVRAFLRTAEPRSAEVWSVLL